MKYSACFLLISIAFCLSCNSNNKPADSIKNTDSSFTIFENRFIDAYWKQNPAAAIYAGYGKYYDILKIPDATAFESDTRFAKNYLDSLKTFDFTQLSSNNKIDYRILENQFYSSIWYTDTFKIQEWDPSGYNLGGECYEIINKDYAPLTKRLKILSAHLQHADAYYAAALKIIHQPTKEHTDLAILQNEGSLEVFGSMLTDSINASALSTAEKDTLQQRITLTNNAIKNYVTELKKILADKNYTFPQL